MLRPSSLVALSATAQRLAVEGAVPADAVGADWLVGIGAAWRHGGAVVAEEEWCSSTLPARNERDLLRRLAFRDPGYRFYLDVLLARVLQAIAAGGRVERVSDLLDGELRGFGPRLALVLRLAEQAQGQEVMGFAPDSWDRFAETTLGQEALDLFGAWDLDLLGEIPGGPEQKFPAVLEHYGPATTAPVCLRCEVWGTDAEAVGFLAEVVMASRDGLAVLLPAGLEGAFRQLQALGLPIRAWRTGRTGDVWVACVGAIKLFVTAGIHTQTAVRSDPPDDLPDEARAGLVVTEGEGPTRAFDLWSAVGKGRRVGGFPGFDLGAPAWPEAPPVPVLAGAPVLPTRQGLASYDDTAVIALAEHPLFGLLLQLLVAEAFAREMGDRRLDVDILGSAADPRLVSVYYQPAKPSDDREPARRVGSLEEVAAELAASAEVYTVPPLYRGEGFGPWTAGLLALYRAGVVVIHRGAVTLDPRLFDRCHDAALITPLIRRGNHLRDSFHAQLRQRWEAVVRREAERESANA